MNQTPRNEHQISSVYILSIFLSVPAGLILGWYFNFGGSWLMMAISIAPALFVTIVAYFHTRHRNRKP